MSHPAPLAPLGPDARGAAASERRAEVLHVVFKVGDADYALAVDVVLQMESYEGATHVPGAPPFVAGVMQVRGRVVPVVDLRTRFGLPALATNPGARVLVGQHGDRIVALCVDSAREVMKIAPDRVAPAPALMGHGAQAFIRGTAQIGTRMILVLDFAKVITEESLDGSA